jgi:hypothetical protein
LAHSAEYKCTEAENTKLANKMEKLTDKVVLGIETTNDNIVQKLT